MIKTIGFALVGVLVGTSALAQEPDAALAQPAPSLAKAEVYSVTAKVKPEKGPEKTATGTITVSRLSSEAQRDELIAALKDGGTSAVRKALSAMKDVGSIQFGKERHALKYAFTRDLGGGQKLITLGADHPLFFLVSDAKPEKSTEGYDVAVIDLQVDGSGKGDGTIAGAAKLKVGPNGGLMVDDYSTYLIRLDPVTLKAK